MAQHSASEIQAPTALSVYESAVLLVAGDLERVEERLLEMCGAGDDPLSLAARGVVEAGGKRLRPLLSLLAARATGRTTSTSVDLAVSIEIIHLASLMHDDVVDEAAVRRGHPAVRQIWGNRTAVLVGDYLAAGAYHELAVLRQGERLTILTEVVMAMCRAEATSAHAELEEITEKDCIAIARGKTGGLFAASCQLGALSTGAGADVCEQFRAYGGHFGVAFQITDDLLDIYGDQETIGKPPGQDIANRQFTLPVIYALHTGLRSEVLEAIERITAEPESEQSLSSLRDTVESAGGRSAAERTAAHHVALAKSSLSEMRGCDAQAMEALPRLADHILTRCY